MILLLSLAALACGTIHIVADGRRAWVTTWWSKPATMLAILAIVLLSPGPRDGYVTLVAVGLLFSLAGDVFLMLPSDRFLPGLASFLVAHLLYIAAFGRAAGLVLSPEALLPFVAYAAVLVPLLWPHFGRMRGPALLYVLAILAMGWQAAGQWLAVREAWAVLALAGAALFVVSDSALAWNRFRAPFHASQLVVLSTYYAAQWLIALSVGR